MPMEAWEEVLVLASLSLKIEVRSIAQRSEHVGSDIPAAALADHARHCRRTSGAPLAPTTIERRDLRPDDMLIDVAYAGICHSDIHQVNQDWGTAIFPMVPGHEIAGVVAAVGADVTKYQQFCVKGNVQTYNGVGLGGLGHLAVKLAVAMGAEVTVLSQSLKKQEDGLRLGAKDYFATGDASTFDVLRRRFDLILNAVSANLPVDSYLGVLGVGGVMVNVGAVLQRHVADRREQRARRVGDRGGSPRPRRCWTSAPSTASARRSRRSRATRSTRPTSESRAATCATGSSSTPRSSGMIRRGWHAA
jgi:hypothetical protein